MGNICKICEKNCWLYATHSFTNSSFLLKKLFIISFLFLGFEIPDEHAERLLTARQIIQYVADHEDSYSN